MIILLPLNSSIWLVAKSQLILISISVTTSRNNTTRIEAEDGSTLHSPLSTLHQFNSSAVVAMREESLISSVHDAIHMWLLTQKNQNAHSSWLVGQIVTYMFMIETIFTTLPIHEPTFLPTSIFKILYSSIN